MSARTIHLFTDTHMGMSHTALAQLAHKDAGIDVEAMPAGQILMFLNKKRDKLKILGAHGRVVGYLKMPQGERIDMQAIQYLPATFGSSGEINYPQALRRTLQERLGETLYKRPSQNTQSQARV